jgi:hypothetical protein
MLVISAGTRNHFALDLDRSVLGVKIENAAQAVGLLNRAARSRELTALTAHEVVIDSDELQIPVRIERKRVVDGLISECRRAA